MIREANMELSLCHSSSLHDRVCSFHLPINLAGAPVLLQMVSDLLDSCPHNLSSTSLCWRPVTASFERSSLQQVFLGNPDVLQLAELHEVDDAASTLKVEKDEGSADATEDEHHETDDNVETKQGPGDAAVNSAVSVQSKLHHRFGVALVIFISPSCPDIRVHRVNAVDEVFLDVEPDELSNSKEAVEWEHVESEHGEHELAPLGLFHSDDVEVEADNRESPLFVATAPLLSVNGAEWSVAMGAHDTVELVGSEKEVHKLDGWLGHAEELLSVFHLFTETTICLAHVLVIVTAAERNLLVAVWAVELTWHHSVVIGTASGTDSGSALGALVL